MSIYHIDCSEIWGGVRGDNLDACTSGVLASLHSSAADGGKGGDIYYISVCASDQLTRVAVADVMGHGEAVSHISQWLYESLRAAMDSLEGNDVLSKLNALVGEHGHKAISTAAVITFFRAKSNLYFSYAGHPPIFAYNRTGKQWQAVTLAPQRKRANLPLGAFPDISYDQGLRPIAPGDRLFLYTDGVVDAPDSQGGFFGQERLLAVLDEAAERPLHDLKKAVADALRKHTGGSLRHDDVTFMALEVR